MHNVEGKSHVVAGMYMDLIEIHAIWFESNLRRRPLDPVSTYVTELTR